MPSECHLLALFGRIDLFQRFAAVEIMVDINVRSEVEDVVLDKAGVEVIMVAETIIFKGKKGEILVENVILAKALDI